MARCCLNKHLVLMWFLVDLQSLSSLCVVGSHCFGITGVILMLGVHNWLA